MQGSLYKQPRMVWLILMLILVAGMNAINVMPRLEDPHMQSRVVNVNTLYPGADAERVEAEVTEKIERKLREIPEVKHISALSNPGVSAITIELEDSVEDAKPITARLRDKVAEVTDLPAGVVAPDFSDTKIYAHSAVIALTWHSDNPINYAIMGRLASELESRLRNLEPTDFVDIKGLPQEEIRISIDDSKLAAHGMTINDVVSAVRASDARGSAGQVTSNDSRLTIEVKGALDSLARIRRIPLRSEERGAALRLGDIATVERTFEDPPRSLSFTNGFESITVSARMLEDFRVDQWSMMVKKVIDEFAATLPQSIQIERIYDQADYTNERIDDLLDNLGVGALVVVIVLFVTLGLRSALISASILPLALLAALAILNIYGMRIQQVLITGMIVALGIMVDNAIVITDEIQHLLLKGERRATAVAKTVKKLWLPLMGSTLTTIIAFLPLMLMPGNAGDFMVGVPAAVIASLVSSYLIAFTLISALAGRVIRGSKSREEFATDSGKRIWWRDGIEGKFASNAFRASLTWSINNPLKSIVVAMFIPMLGFYAAGNLTEQFFPVSDRDQFRIELSLPGDASIYQTQKMVHEVDAFVRMEKAVVAANWTLGEGSPKFYYNMLDNKTGIPSFAEGVIQVTEQADVEQLVPKFQRILSDMYPEMRVLVRELGTGPPIMAPIEIRVVGPELAMLDKLGEQVRSIMATIPNVTHTATSLKSGRPQILVAANEDEVLVTGMSLQEVSEQLRGLSGGVIATHLIEETERVPLRVMVNKSGRRDIDSIANMNLRSRTEREQDNSFKDVPLSALGKVELSTKVGVIHRRDGERINNVQGFLEFGILPADAFTEMKKRLTEANIDIPPGYRIEFGGETEKRGEAVGKLFGTVGLLLVMMLIAIVLTFNSFRLAVVTLLAAVQAAGLGFLSLWVMDYPLSFVVIIGLMGLIGLSINAAIVILSELRGRDAAREGDPEEVIDGVMSTGRHIISTTLTTVGGFMPLILAGGSFWPPFAVAIAGGAFLSMIVSFYFAPAAFYWMTRRNQVSAPSGEGAPLRFKL